MSKRNVEIPRPEVVTSWYRVSRAASPAFQSFFGNELGPSINVDKSLTVSRDFDAPVYHIIRLDDDDVVKRHLTFKIPRPDSALDIWDLQQRAYVCPYSTLSKIGVELSVVVQDVSDARSAIIDQIISR